MKAVRMEGRNYEDGSGKLTSKNLYFMHLIRQIKYSKKARQLLCF